jgi:hypothetical protein
MTATPPTRRYTKKHLLILFLTWIGGAILTSVDMGMGARPQCDTRVLRRSLLRRQ